MSHIERRSSVRKPIRMACGVQFSSGITISGNTRNISLGGVEIETTSVSGNKDRILTPGELGLLTLKFRKGGAPESIIVQCQVVQVLGNGLGLSASFSDLNKREQDMLGQIIGSGTAQIA